MHINIKYFIISIGSIFIAIGLGILVGFNLNKNEDLINTQTAMIQELDKNFNELSKKDDELQKSLDEYKGKYSKSIAYLESKSTQLIGNMLEDKNIGIICLNGDKDTSEKLLNTLNTSGANTTFNISITDSINDEKKLKEVANEIGIKVEDTKGMIDYIVNSITTQNNVEAINKLKDSGMIEINFIANSYADFESLVIVEGDKSKSASEKFEQLDAFLVEAVQAKEKHIIEVQNSNVKTSYVTEYEKKGVTTIDNIDQNVGFLSLAILVSDPSINGNYGVLDTAKCVVPVKE
ncbi:MAG: copper transporter [Clostridioides sp.]|jgi:hypothetical protein|nr:copper transporter [Clostridioides sp.]